MQRKWRRKWQRGQINSKQDGFLKSFKQIWAKGIFSSMAAAGIMLGCMTGAGASTVLPTGGEIVAGAGTISQDGNTLTINQGTQKMIANWQSFSIGADGKVQFIQPGANAIALNRVLGNDASGIYGQLTANGRVFLINPNGVVFAPGAQVSVGGLVASTLNISDNDFLAGNYKFSGDGGTVTNEGTITAANGGYVALLASEVQNDGIIIAQQGTVALGAGKAITLDMNGDGLLSLAVDQAAINAGAANHNLIQADGGQVIMAAGTAEKLARTVLNNSGIIRARSLNNVDGAIILDGGANGAVSNSGTLDASGQNAGEHGGTVKVLGDSVTLGDGAMVDVSGANGGGTVLIGGNAQGQGTERNAATTTVAKGATITADARWQGDGGQVVVWADDTTNYYGTISARGGAISGNGGSAEVSGKQQLVYKGTADLRAPQGQTGTLLLDPADYTIAANGGDMTGAELGSQLRTANVTILSNDGTVNTDGSGDINVNDAVTWSSGNTLTLSAYRDVNVNADITGTGGGSLVLRADNTGAGSTTLGAGHGTVSIADGAAVSMTGGTGSGNNVSIYYNPVNYADTATYSTVSPITVTGGDNEIVYNPYINKVSGNLTAYMLVNSVDDLQNMQTNTAGVYALSKDIDAIVTKSWNNGAGFAPLGTSAINGNTGFTGIFDGDGHVIRGLYINKPNEAVGVGLFGGTNGATIRNVGLENVDITGSYHIGSLIGEAVSTNISNCYSTGTVSTVAVPGLSIYPAGYTGSKLVYENVAVGGLVGLLARASNTTINSTLINSYSSVAVAGAGDGSQDASGNTLHYYGRAVGGLVGFISGANVANCYSTGQVNDVGSYAEGVGGFIGYSAYEAVPDGNTVSNCYTTSQVTSTSNGLTNRSVAGFIGLASTNTSITNCYAAGTVARFGDPGSTADLYAFTATSFNSLDGFSNCYWNSETYGSVTPPSGGTLKGASYSNPRQAWKLEGHIDKLTTAEMLKTENYKGWDFNTTWYLIEDGTQPFLRSEYSTAIRNAHQLQLMVMNLDADYTLCNNVNLSGYNMAAYGFVPIGSADNPFSGTLDGNGNYISGLTINDPTATAVGLFGYTNAAAHISDVGLSGVNITGSTNNQYIGSLVGYNNGGYIAHAYSAGTVSGDENTDSAGGLVGYNKGTVEGCYSISAVRGYHNIGGVAGTNAGSIINSYYDVAGVVTGIGANAFAGGLAGANSGAVTSSYSAGLVTASDGTAGGLVGKGAGGTITSAVWDTDSSGQSNGVGDAPAAAGVTGLSTAAMDEQTNYTGWDFTDIWSIVNGARPVLQWESTGSNVITTLSQLRLISANLSGVYILGDNIALTGIWTPLGSADNPFTGILKGNGYTLSGLNIEDSSSAALGLFSYTQGAGISGVNLTGVHIVANANNLYVGSLVGYNGSGSSIANCTGTGTISVNGSSSAGGLVGYNAAGSTIENCTSAVNISGTGSIGGLAGINAGSILSSYNTGALTGSGNIGGLAGRNLGSITNAYNTGTVTATGSGSKAGGLAGENAGDIAYAYSSGTISGSGDNSAVGGLVGENAGSITYAYRTGTVTATGAGSRAGGLAGSNDGSIAYAYSIGTTTGTGMGSKAGGLAGENTGSINYAYSVGTTTGGTAGGLVGENSDSGTISNARWDIETSGQAYAVGAGSMAGVQDVQGLITADMMKSGNYWNLADTWGMIEGISFPYLKKLYDGTPQFISGKVLNGGLGKNVNLVYNSQVIGKAATIGDNGFYYLIVAPDKTVPDDSVLLTYVAGDSAFKANSAYLYEGGGGLAGVNLEKGVLNVNGGSGTVDNDDLNDVKGAITSDDIIYTANTHPYTDYYPGSQDPYYSLLPCTLLTVDGDLRGENYSPGNGDIHATGSITITVPGDFFMNSTHWNNATSSSSGNVNNQQFIAGGDINITCRGNFVMYYGCDVIVDDGEALYNPNEEPRLIAGGDINITCGGYFVNKTGTSKWVSDEWDHGDNHDYTYFGNSTTRYLSITSSANAFQLTGDGRWLVTAKDRLIYSTAANESLFYDVRGLQTAGDYWYNVGIKKKYLTNGDEMILNSAGDLVYDFALWGAAGESVPQTGNGFIYTSASPVIRTLTSRQLTRREVIAGIHSDNTRRRGEIVTLAPALNMTPETLPFLTISGTGLAQPSDTDKLNLEASGD